MPPLVVRKEKVEVAIEQEHYLRTRIVWLNESSWVNIHPFQVDGLGADGLTLAGGVASAAPAVGGLQMEQVGTVFVQQRK